MNDQELATNEAPAVASTVTNGPVDGTERSGAQAEAVTNGPAEVVTTPADVDDAAVTKGPGWHLTKWRGLDNWECDRCPFASTGGLMVIEAHIKQFHGPRIVKTGLVDHAGKPIIREIYPDQ